jgi:hypothetical protein
MPERTWHGLRRCSADWQLHHHVVYTVAKRRMSKSKRALDNRHISAISIIAGA